MKNPEEFAFTPEGIEDLNKNISQYNGGKFHQPIVKVRTYEKGKGRFVLGQTGNKKCKYVQGAPNLFFAVYERKDNGQRMFDIASLDKVIEHQKQQVSDGISKSQQSAITIKNILEDRNKEVEVNYLFHLSPNDLVYVPTEEEQENISGINFSNLTKEQVNRVYKIVSFSNKDLQCINSRIAHYVVPYNRKEKNKGEIGWDNKSAQTMEDDAVIRDVCIKLKIDRLGNISKA